MQDEFQIRLYLGRKDKNKLGYDTVQTWVLNHPAFGSLVHQIRKTTILKRYSEGKK